LTPDDIGAWLRLTLTPGVGRVTARKLLAAFGLPSQVLAQSPTALTAVVGPNLAHRLQQPPEGWQAQFDLTLAWLDQDTRHHLIALGDSAYPDELLHTEDPPLMLYVQGDLTVLRHPLRLAMVGSRSPTPQGAENAHRFAQALAQAGVCVVSGLAQGVDGAAHEGALAGGGPTLAVVGTGLDQVYPRRHQSLARRIAETGAVISEYPLGTPPLAPHFPQRNRIISGLSQGVLVVEAALASGSLITARQAIEQGREVFAIPGSIHAPQSKGCHALIRQGAKLVESAQDVLEDLRWTAPAPGPSATRNQAPQGEASPAPAVTADPLLTALGHEPCGLDALQARTGWATAALQARLLDLELDGLVTRLPGGLYQRLHRG